MSRFSKPYFLTIYMPLFLPYIRYFLTLFFLHLKFVLYTQNDDLQVELIRSMARQDCEHLIAKTLLNLKKSVK